MSFSAVTIISIEKTQDIGDFVDLAFCKSDEFEASVIGLLWVHKLAGYPYPASL
jgi:hypothetical protein